MSSFIAVDEAFLREPELYTPGMPPKYGVQLRTNVAEQYKLMFAFYPATKARNRDLVSGAGPVLETNVVYSSEGATFDGSTSRLQYAHSPRFENMAITIIAVVDYNTADSSGVVVSPTNGSDIYVGFGLYTVSSTQYVAQSEGLSSIWQTIVNYAQTTGLHTIAFSNDGNSARIWQDGVLRSTDGIPAVSAPSTDAGALHIGQFFRIDSYITLNGTIKTILLFETGHNQSAINRILNDIYMFVEPIGC